MEIELKELDKLITSALKKIGYNSEEIDAIKKILLYAQIRGNNQGVVKLVDGMPKDPNAQAIKIEKETPISARINGGQNQAMVVVEKALKITLEKVKNSGIAIVGTNNTSTSSGAIGYLTSEIAKEGFVGIVLAGSTPRVVAAGSYEPIFGTNPIAIGIPAKPEPIVLDITTAAMAFYGVVEAKTAGIQLPENIAYDKEGNPTTDPAEAIAGALKSFDRSHRGSGLAMMVEILAGPLVGSACKGVGNPVKDWGHFILAIDPDILGDREEFIKNTTTLVENIKKSKKLPEVEEIFVPGERGNGKANKVIQSGRIEIEDNLLAALRKVAS